MAPEYGTRIVNMQNCNVVILSSLIVCFLRKASSACTQTLAAHWWSPCCQHWWHSALCNIWWFCLVLDTDGHHSRHFKLVCNWITHQHCASNISKCTWAIKFLNTYLFCVKHRVGQLWILQQCTCKIIWRSKGNKRCWQCLTFVSFNADFQLGLNSARLFV